MSTMSCLKIAQTIEGVVALCLGSADRVVWVDQMDAAAFSNGEKLFLPRPTGAHAQEYDLLLAMALREVAKVTYCDVREVGQVKSASQPYGVAIEEARIKKEFGIPYKGAKDVFGKAFSVVADIFSQHVNVGNLQPEMVNQMAIWAGAQHGYLQTDSSVESMNTLYRLAATVAEVGKLNSAMELAQQAVQTASTREAMDLGNQVWNLLKEEPADSQEQAGDQNDAAGEPAENAGQDGPGDEQDAGDASPKPGEGTGRSDDDKSEEAQGTETGGGPANSASGAEQPSQKGVDALSEALARLRGFSEACDVSKDADALEKGAPAAGPELTEMQLDAIRKALEKAAGVHEELEKALALAESNDGEAAGAAGVHDLASLVESEEVNSEALVVHAGGGFAKPDTSGRNTLLSGVAGRLVTVFLKEFQETTRRPLMLKQSGQRVSASNVWKLKRLGDTRVFLPKVKTTGVNTLASIMLDTSDSMTKQIGEATKVTHALALAMQRISGVQLSIDVFPGVACPSMEILKFKQSVRTVHSKLESLVADGGTPTGRALQFRLDKLKGIQADKKVILVITDGLPNATERPLTKLMLERAKAEDVDVFAIGIGRAAQVELFFDQFIKVETVNHLAGAFEALFKSELAAKLAA